MFGSTDRIIEDLDEIVESKINEAFTNSFNFYLDTLRKMVDDEKEIIQNSAADSIKEIRSAGAEFKKFYEISNNNNDLAKEIQKLVSEIRKRDAIIERKNKQIAKLKTENGI